MAQSGRPTLTKRQLEARRRTKRQIKEARRAQRKADRQQQIENPRQSDPAVDPDIADIVPGPQPPRF